MGQPGSDRLIVRQFPDRQTPRVFAVFSVAEIEFPAAAAAFDLDLVVSLFQRDGKNMIGRRDGVVVIAKPLAGEVINRFSVDSDGKHQTADPEPGPAVRCGRRTADQHGAVAGSAADILQIEDPVLYPHCQRVRDPVPNGDDSVSGNDRHMRSAFPCIFVAEAVNLPIFRQSGLKHSAHGENCCGDVGAVDHFFLLLICPERSVITSRTSERLSSWCRPVPDRDSPDW